MEKLAALADLSEPPLSSTITEARKLIVNWADGESIPAIETMPGPDGETSIVFRWDKAAYTLGPGGRCLVSSY